MSERFEDLWGDVHAAMAERATGTPHSDGECSDVARKLWALGYRPAPSEADDRDTLLRLLARHGVPTEYQTPSRRGGW